MYQKGFYKTKGMDPKSPSGRRKIAEDVRKEGFNPILITNKPGFIYPEHKHPETKLLIFLEGGMCVTVDKLIVPGNTIHSAKVDSSGCTFFWSEKIL